MKKLQTIILCLICIMLMMASAGAAGHETAYDKYAKPDPKFNWPTEVANDAPAYRPDRSVSEAVADEGTAMEMFGQIWYDLLQGELAQGIDMKESFAADIYNGMTKKQVLISIIAEDPEAVCLNFIVGVFDKKKDAKFKTFFGNIYWIEWNTEDLVLRAANNAGGVTTLKNASDIMQDYVYASWMINAAGGNIIMNKRLPAGSVLYQLTGGKNLLKVLNDVYAEQNDGLKPFKTKSR